MISSVFKYLLPITIVFLHAKNISCVSIPIEDNSILSDNLLNAFDTNNETSQNEITEATTAVHNFPETTISDDVIIVQGEPEVYYKSTKDDDSNKYNEELEKITNSLHELTGIVSRLKEEMENLREENTILKNTVKTNEKEIFRNREDVIHRPRARLYSGPNMTGEYEDFNPLGKSHPDCYSLKKLGGKVQSISTFGSCVRLYNSSDNGCDGWSLAVYPRIPVVMTSSSSATSSKTTTITTNRNNKVIIYDGSSISNNNIVVDNNDQNNNELKIFLSQVVDISSCFDNELDSSVMDYNMDNIGEYQKLYSNLYKKLHVVPDLIRVGYDDDYSLISKAPIEYYRTGNNGRLEYMRAVIKLNDIERGIQSSIEYSNVTKQILDFYNLDRTQDDIMVNPISLRFGTPANLLFSVIPIMKSNYQILLGYEEKIFQYYMMSGIKRKNNNNNNGTISGQQGTNDNNKETDGDQDEQQSEQPRSVYVYVNVAYADNVGTRPIGISYYVNNYKDFNFTFYLPNLKP